jgi:hypothetical protein
MPSFDLLVPSWLDLAGWAGVLFATLVFIGLGRLLSRGRATPEAALIAGWGAAVIVLTLWGVAAAVSLRLPATALAAIGLLAHGVPRLRLGKAEWQAIGRIAALALPLLAVMASARPSLPDTWLNLLPNAAYIYDHGFFPADTRPVAHSFIAGAPYNMQLAAFIAGLVTPGFPPNAMIGLNLILQLATALLLARLAAGDDRTVPSWTLAALGLLLATALNPGFVPRYHLSAYSEPAVTVTVAFAGWFAARALDRLDGGRDPRLDLWLLALTLAALVNIKQESIMLVVSLLIAAAILVLAVGIDKSRALVALGLAALPAIVLYGAWRWYVLDHFEVGELKNLPLAEWHFVELPQILWNMLRAAASRIFLFLCLTALIAVAAWRLSRREIDLGTRVAVMLAGTAIAYNAMLVFAYIAHFEGEMGIGAHSYFRYNTHLGLLFMVAVVALARSWNWPKLAQRLPRLVPAALIVLVLLDPFPFLRMLRFDLEVPSQRVWDLAHAAAAQIAPDEALMLILPGENGSVAPALEGVLRYTPPRRPDVALTVVTDPHAALAARADRRALLSCAPPGFDDVPAGTAALLARDASSWRAERVWPYAPVPPHARWSQVLAPAALCLGG